MKRLFLTLLGTLLIAFSAQISWTPIIGDFSIPITGQTLGVLFVAYVLPKKMGFYSVLLYIALGCIGLPIFADWSGGLDVLIGKSGGYIIGFAMAALCISMLRERHSYSILRRFNTHLFATVIILIFGVVRLSMFIGLDSALTYGLYPFLLGGVIKIVIGSYLSLWFDKSGFLKTD